MNLTLIKQKKQSGDMRTAAKMLGISPQYADKILSRPKSKRYTALITALTSIIEARENMIEEMKKITGDKHLQKRQ